jgi:hypothetical protein
MYVLRRAIASTELRPGEFLLAIPAKAGIQRFLQVNKALDPGLTSSAVKNRRDDGLKSADD